MRREKMGRGVVVRVGRWVVVCCWMVALSGCVGVGPEAVELSRALGERIGAMEAVHRRLIVDCFEARKGEVGRFVEERWGPVMAEEFFADPVVAGAWEEVAASGDAEERRRFVVETGRRLTGAVEAKKRELEGPLEAVEAAVLERVGGEYGRMREANAALTGLLDSAAAVSGFERGIRERVGLSKSKVDEIVSKAGAVVGGLVGAAGSAEGVVAGIEGFKREIEGVLAGVGR